MGLVKAALGAASGVMGDQWKEYFYCSALPAEVLAVKGQKKVSGRSSNRHGTENVITDGSIVAVAEGQCALIVEQGKVVDLCAEPGEYTYSTGTQPSLLRGGRKNIDSVFAELGSGQEHRRGLCGDRQAVQLRRSGRQRPAHLLHQHQGADGQQVRHSQPGALPCGGPAGRHRHRREHPVLRRVQLPHRQPHPVLHQRLRKCGK